MVAGVRLISPCPRLTLGVATALAFAIGPRAALAQMPIQGAALKTTESGEAGARKHFDRALELYRAGRYAEALPELERAAELDPDGKDLFFNLALVHEKLSQLPAAIVALERYRELETDPREQERARLSIERLKGAEAAAAPAPNPVVSSCPELPVVASVPPEPAKPSAMLIGAASVAVVSLVVAAVFGVKALTDDVSDVPTSSHFSIDQWHERARRAEREALVADVALALSAASGATFAGVWLLSADAPARRAAGVTLGGSF